MILSQALGGRVEAKVPRQGFVLIQPSSNEADRLKLCWESQDRPERHFVPYTYVEACKIAGMLLKQIFVENGEAIKFHIDSSIANINARAALGARIMVGYCSVMYVMSYPLTNPQHSGGDPSASAQTARVILADPNTEIFQHLVKSYQGVPGKYVESYLWVKKSVEKGTVVYTPLVYKNPGGRRPGEEYARYPVSPMRRPILTSFLGGHNSRKKTRSISAIGSLPRSLTRRQAVGLATDSTSNFVTWYVTLLVFFKFLSF